jgi:hypothetical protein
MNSQNLRSPGVRWVASTQEWTKIRFVTGDYEFDLVNDFPGVVRSVTDVLHLKVRLAEVQFILLLLYLVTKVHKWDFRLDLN